MKALLIIVMFGFILYRAPWLAALIVVALLFTMVPWLFFVVVIGSVLYVVNKLATEEQP